MLIEFPLAQSVAVDFPDGRYTRGQILAEGSKYAILASGIPRADRRYVAAHVRDGVFDAVELVDEDVQAAPAPPPPPPTKSEPAPAAPAPVVDDKPKPKVFFGKRG